MTEDLGIGFGWFNLRDGTSIANDSAVQHASSHLYNQTAIENAGPHLGRAVEAVQEAIRMKELGHDPGHGDQNQTSFTDAIDFIL